MQSKITNLHVSYFYIRKYTTAEAFMCTPYPKLFIQCILPNFSTSECYMRSQIAYNIEYIGNNKKGKLHIKKRRLLEWSVLLKDFFGKKLLRDKEMSGKVKVSRYH